MSLCSECKSTLKDTLLNVTQSKYALHLLSSPYFKCICKTCINFNDIDKSNSISDSMNSLNKLSNQINDMHKVICMHYKNIINDSDNDDINNSIN